MQTALPLDGKGGSAPLVLRVSEVSGIIVDALDIPDLREIWVQGEVSNFRPHPSGHHYFSLSETVGSQGYLVNCVMWRSSACRLDFNPANGMAVVVSGSLQVYEPQGKYQLIVREMKKAGEGEKHLLVERWKKELLAEGLFDPARKRELPRFPSRVGVVTAASGAAFQDICTIIGRRYPVEIVLSPTAVQGDGAHVEIAAAVARLAGKVDVIIVGRGGGSFEDLFPFNHPDVVRAVAAAPVPVVSAVGHDVDWVLCDMAADRRAPTPSAAAELVVPDRAEMGKEIGSLRDRMGNALVKRVVHGREVLEELRQRIHPARFE
ncbi:MAG: exodeoxyribonuclease VII large subunit, partial [Methanomicrobiales archaeon]|nr:exodeoxyribonuclease VII large subunit [Methanomicrobiales archaeon]